MTSSTPRCFAPAPKGSIGLDSGYDRLRGPGLFNWDMSLFKNISIKERARMQLRLEAFNVFNHAEWATFNTTAQFNAAGQIVNLPTQFGGTGGRFGFGAENIDPRQQPAHSPDRGEVRL